MSLFDSSSVLIVFGPNKSLDSSSYCWYFVSVCRLSMFFTTGFITGFEAKPSGKLVVKVWVKGLGGVCSHFVENANPGAL